jgi:hypothetical protein
MPDVVTTSWLTLGGLPLLHMRTLKPRGTWLLVLDDPRSQGRGLWGVSGGHVGWTTDQLAPFSPTWWPVPFWLVAGVWEVPTPLLVGLFIHQLLKCLRRSLTSACRDKPTSRRASLWPGLGFPCGQPSLSISWENQYTDTLTTLIDLNRCCFCSAS